jgi:hypothetical protein
MYSIVPNNIHHYHVTVTFRACDIDRMYPFIYQTKLQGLHNVSLCGLIGFLNRNVKTCLKT